MIRHSHEQASAPNNLKLFCFWAIWGCVVCLAGAKQGAGAELGLEAKRGEELARIYCSACHLQPPPSLLTKTEWLHHILPAMAANMGVEPPNYEGMSEGKILQAAHVFPLTPMIPQPDWLAIWQYYKEAAPSEPLPQPAKAKIESTLPLFRPKRVNFHTGVPTICLLKIDPAGKRCFVGDSVAGVLASLGPSGEVLGRARMESPPVRLVPSGSSMLLTLIGRFFPSDSLQGSVVEVTRTGTRTLISELRRPTDARSADLNGDGREDLVVCSFGNRLGSFSWFENRGTGYVENVLLERPGATRSELYDFNRDGRLDIMVLTGQAREGIYLYYNQGKGEFTVETILEEPPAFGYVDFELVNWNRDGHMDLLAVNGDNGDNPTPRKPYHGLRLYLNDGTNHFKLNWFYPMHGAYKTATADYDGDGDLDVAAIAYYPDFNADSVENFVYLENLGDGKLLPRTVPEAASGRWMVMDAGDLDGDGDIDLALGSFVLGPTTIAVPPELRDRWRTEGAAVLLLENRRR